MSKRPVVGVVVPAQGKSERGSNIARVLSAAASVMTSSPEGRERLVRLASAERAVVKAALAWYDSPGGSCNTHESAEAHVRLCDACLTLKHLSGR